MDRIFQGKRVGGVRLVEVLRGERVLLLPLKPSLQIAEHLSDGFNWGNQGSGPAQLALGFCMRSLGMWGYREVSTSCSSWITSHSAMNTGK